MAKKLLINEIFYSIQGEGCYSGVPTVFVRLQGCNLSCPWCDTKYAQAIADKNVCFLMDTDSLLNKIKSFVNHTNVCITGGEPLLQKDALLCMVKIFIKCPDIKRVIIQTNGSIDIKPFLLPKVIIAMDYKLFSSGQTGKMRFENIQSLREGDELKFVVADREDFNQSLNILSKYSLKPQIVYSAVYPIMKYSELAKMIIDNNINCRFMVQLHKVIWPHIDRGV